ncbi:hypothetical protein Moror_6058 [Moniliophthora roreri MCA 2997]|uniref:Reverse transcriptase-rnase h-integrase n=2 Tax=Moniliophthora roreri TaxID=221103 RepID=V2W8E6_MONRO|nr:hypothetical protein Moror_6058 [Moniliophthora roreri MCA 2997]
MNKETESSETKAKSSPELSPTSEPKNLDEIPSEPDMTTPGRSSDQPTDLAPNVQLKQEQDNSDAQWTSKPDPYESDHKDTRRFLLNLEVFFRMNASKYNTDEKKKLLLLSLLKGRTKEWKMTEQMKIFPEDPKSTIAKKAAEEKWDDFKARFRAYWQPIDVKGDTQIRIEELQMKE